MEAIIIVAMVLMMGIMLFGGHRMMGGHEREGGAKDPAHRTMATNRVDQGATETAEEASRRPAEDNASAVGRIR